MQCYQELSKEKLAELEAIKNKEVQKTKCLIDVYSLLDNLQDIKTQDIDKLVTELLNKIKKKKK